MSLENFSFDETNNQEPIDKLKQTLSEELLQERPYLTGLPASGPVKTRLEQIAKNSNLEVPTEKILAVVNYLQRLLETLNQKMGREYFSRTQFYRCLFIISFTTQLSEDSRGWVKNFSKVWAGTSYNHKDTQEIAVTTSESWQKRANKFASLTHGLDKVWAEIQQIDQLISVLTATYITAEEKQRILIELSESCRLPEEGIMVEILKSELKIYKQKQIAKIEKTKFWKFVDDYNTEDQTMRDQNNFSHTFILFLRKFFEQMKNLKIDKQSTETLLPLFEIWKSLNTKIASISKKVKKTIKNNDYLEAITTIAANQEEAQNPITLLLNYLNEQEVLKTIIDNFDLLTNPLLPENRLTTVWPHTLAAPKLNQVGISDQSYPTQENTDYLTPEDIELLAQKYDIYIQENPSDINPGRTAPGDIDDLTPENIGEMEKGELDEEDIQDIQNYPN